MRVWERDANGRLLGPSVVSVIYFWPPSLPACLRCVELPSGQTMPVEASSRWSLPFPGTVGEAEHPAKVP